MSKVFKHKRGVCEAAKLSFWLQHCGENQFQHMARRIVLKYSRKNAVIVCLGIFALSTLYLAIAPIQGPCECGNGEKSATESQWDNPSWGDHRLAVVVPFRDRFDELQEFVPYMHNYLYRKKIRHKIYVVNQMDILRFNRASLINIGFLESERDCDYVAMHDVDLLPMNDDLSYSFPDSGPFHVASPELHPKYDYSTFVGGILLLSNEQFRLVNGMSNKYWGWGKEDDEFFIRMKKANLVVHRPQDITTGRHTFKHIHDRRRRPRDTRRYLDQKKKSRIPDSVTGLDTIQYDIVSKVDMLVEGAPVTVINVELKCDLDLTPWCTDNEMYDLIQQYLLAEKHGEVGKRLKDGKPASKFREPIDLHNFIIKDRDVKL